MVFVLIMNATVILMFLRGEIESYAPASVVKPRCGAATLQVAEKRGSKWLTLG